ncbi:MAG: bifunctional hydroxymethylpyrimidine kinase/phosphomethylpyrimidine kinase [Candidatus Edwardsbacteria bacterium]
MQKVRLALTIAGSDPTGGAGIQVDLKTFSAFGLYGFSVLTAITVQNTVGVKEIFPVPADFVSHQLEALLSLWTFPSSKAGMLTNSSIVESVAEKIKESQIGKFVLDPVMKAKNGTLLLDEPGQEMLIKKLLPLTWLITPNIEEAKIITGVEIKNLTTMKKAARVINQMGSKNVLIKGGHLTGKPLDLLFNGKSFRTYEDERLPKEMHGTGCAFSAAITALLAKGESLEKSVEKAKMFVNRAIADSLCLGGKYSLFQTIRSGIK